MTTVTIDFPEGVLSALRKSPTEFAKEVRVAVACHWYQQGTVSQEKGAEIAGLDRAEFHLELSRRKIDVFQVDLEGLREELRRG